MSRNMIWWESIKLETGASVPHNFFFIVICVGFFIQSASRRLLDFFPRFILLSLVSLFFFFLNFFTTTLVGLNWTSLRPVRPGSLWVTSCGSSLQAESLTLLWLLLLAGLESKAYLEPGFFIVIFVSFLNGMWEGKCERWWLSLSSTYGCYFFFRGAVSPLFGSGFWKCSFPPALSWSSPG